MIRQRSLIGRGLSGACRRRRRFGSDGDSEKVALVMGVANNRSIAWHCVEKFLAENYQVIWTCQTSSQLSKSSLQPLVQHPNVLGALAYEVSDESESQLSEQLSDLLQDRRLSAVVHSLAHAPNIKTTPLLQTTSTDFLEAQRISAHSLIQVARATLPFSPSAITTLSYLGATRAIPGYHAMGPAKASLESVVRGLALELGSSGTRVNAVSAGPLPTLAAKGGIAGFDLMRKDVEERAPLGNISAPQVANVLHFLSTDAASGITGQIIHVDGGYSIVGGPSMSGD